MATLHPSAVQGGRRANTSFMYYVYILLLSNKQLYCGISTNLQRRLRDHKKGKSPFTKNRLPVKLIFYETYINNEDAEKRERYFKSSKGKRTLRAMLKNTLIQFKYKRAGVAKLVYALGLGPSGSNPVEVQVLSPALSLND